MKKVKAEIRVYTNTSGEYHFRIRLLSQHLDKSLLSKNYSNRSNCLRAAMRLAERLNLDYKVIDAYRIWQKVSNGILDECR